MSNSSGPESPEVRVDIRRLQFLSKRQTVQVKRQAIWAEISLNISYQVYEVKSTKYFCAALSIFWINHIAISLPMILFFITTIIDRMYFNFFNNKI